MGGSHHVVSEAVPMRMEAAVIGRPLEVESRNLKEFAFDAKLLEQEWKQQTLLPLLWPCCMPVWPCTILMHFLCIRQNIDDKIKSMRVNLTDEQIEYEEGPYFTCLRHDACGKQGRVNKVIPYDRVQDVRLEEPAGNYCCVFPFKITLVSVQTAGGSVGHIETWMPGREFQGGKVGRSELELWGLEDATAFRNMILDMKKKGKGLGGAGDGMGSTSAPSQQRMASGGGRMEALLEEQLSLLRSIDASLKSMAKSAATAS
mmetsp:Transcript_56147/g.142990  ORF Transcript_56147/g.142990 Transcript_56147/m.142990 type:complete len:259 (-) Transcript_56147:45-821(-)